MCGVWKDINKSLGVNLSLIAALKLPGAEVSLYLVLYSIIQKAACYIYPYKPSILPRHRVTWHKFTDSYFRSHSFAWVKLVFTYSNMKAFGVMEEAAWPRRVKRCKNMVRLSLDSNPELLSSEANMVTITPSYCRQNKKTKKKHREKKKQHSVCGETEQKKKKWGQCFCLVCFSLHDSVMSLSQVATVTMSAQPPQAPGDHSSQKIHLINKMFTLLFPTYCFTGFPMKSSMMPTIKPMHNKEE